jgi:hypothetical protein
MFGYERQENFFGKPGLWDATTGRRVLDSWPTEEISLVLNNPGKLLVGCVSCADRKLYSNSGVPDHALAIDPAATAVSFSPDARRMVFVKNRDLWVVDVDWDSAVVRNPRQITQVGIFDKARGYWHGDTLLYGGYRISLADHSVKEAPVGWYRIEKRVAPDGSVVIGERTNNDLYAYDVAKDQIVTLRTGMNIRDYLWLDNRRAVMIHGNRDIILFDRNANKVEVVVPKLNLQDSLFAPSPQGRYFFGTEFMGQERVLAIDSADWSVVPISKDIRQIEWLTATTFLFTREAPVDKRGTWIFDLLSKTEKKVSAYPYDAVAVLPDAGVFVFLANSNLWRSKLDGTEFTQLTTTDTERGKLWPALPRITSQS